MKKQHFIKGTRGSIIVEFALVIPLFFLMLAAAADFGLVMLRRNDINIVLTTGLHYTLLSKDVVSVENAMQSATSISHLQVSAVSSCECANEISTSCTNQCTNGSTPKQYFTLSAETFIHPVFTIFISDPYTIKKSIVVRLR
ncbi:MAG: TadE/TadG family type IV pilus assembly protein [Candidatus Nucleicultricaceae bacterium]